jgi:hypothetical protein
MTRETQVETPDGGTPGDQGGTKGDKGVKSDQKEATDKAESGSRPSEGDQAKDPKGR